MLQEVMPVRVKAIYIVNQPIFFSVILHVVRLFIREKVRRRINLVGDATHHSSFIDKEAIPTASA